MLAVANALQLQALGVEHSQKRARQARTLDGPDALRKVGGWKMCGAACRVVDLVDLFFFSTCGYIFFLFGLGMLGKLVMILILMLSTGQALLEADREAA